MCFLYPLFVCVFFPFRVLFFTKIRIGDFVLKISDLTFSYSNRKILDKLCLQVDQGCSVAILGSSGSGKTTLMNAFNGVDSKAPKSTVAL